MSAPFQTENPAVRITDNFWTPYLSLISDTVIPYQWKALNDEIPDAAPSYAIRNLRIAAGLEEGEFGGMVFQDSDPAKWLEAVAYSLAAHPDPRLEQLADGLIDLIVQAQQPDGYLNTYFTIAVPDGRWTNLHECHELYCAGHMIEAAVAYYESTGKRKLLDAMCRFADYIDTVFGNEPGKLQGYDGHQEIELALVKLYKATGEERYRRLSQYFIDQRGQAPHYFMEEWLRRGKTSYWRPGAASAPDPAYMQSHLPVREQNVAVGHAVRAVYMYAAMADLALLNQDESLAEACRRLWANLTGKQMYVTGGIGSTHHGEAFTFDYDLPNDTVYAETCASIGLIFFARRMLELEQKSDYADVMERALYNLVLGSMSLDGTRYFYVNPLEVWPEACKKDPGKHHVKPERQKWFGCSCCPPNVARLLASLGQYIYSVHGSKLFAHLYIGCEAEFTVEQETVGIRQQSALPWTGEVSFQLRLAKPKRMTLALRVPAWCSGEAALKINGEIYPDSLLQVVNGYTEIDRLWADNDLIEWTIPVSARFLEGHPSIRALAGQAAIERGPLVYCLEEADNGAPLASLVLSAGSGLREAFEPNLFGGVYVIEGEAWKDDEATWQETQLYRRLRLESRPATFRAVPYFLWGNRGLGEMTVWARVR
ncbi:hypothetical protein SAMN02799630_03879 [Paenibacillus sp. UNCCL117]|uniref:glycoside hydrolase family 127 protein n=1 Tax=unclassified Paenibacillus TaxID=185978 RepID=UPI00089259F1|nr:MULTISPECIES: beta-L-arabinofuranosidase domain-containing protein [unclassified Paenibacillus]SDD56965.1 hypothetical protein SAMN04488602_11057 [Paenibacillus sp. cl123]SFW51278.1 hypothetical protein SAMN02799630_03879 [Paenibacillus sp. UNCCL117]